MLVNLFLDFFHLESNIDVDGHATFGGLQGRAQPKQVVPVEQDLPLSLEEVYNGTIRKLKISKRVCNRSIEWKSLKCLLYIIGIE